MNKTYETPSIQIIEFEAEVRLEASCVIYYPWRADEDFEFFE